MKQCKVESFKKKIKPIKENNWKYIIIFIFFNIMFSICYALMASVFLLEYSVSGKDNWIGFIVILGILVYTLVFTKNINKRNFGSEIIISTVITIVVSYFFKIVPKTLYYLKHLLESYVSERKQVEYSEVQKFFGDNFFSYKGIDIFIIVTISSFVIMIGINIFFFFNNRYKRKKAVKNLCGEWLVNSSDEDRNVVITKLPKNCFSYTDSLKSDEKVLLRLDLIEFKTILSALTEDGSIRYEFSLFKDKNKKSNMTVSIKKNESKYDPNMKYLSMVRQSDKRY